MDRLKVAITVKKFWRVISKEGIGSLTPPWGLRKGDKSIQEIRQKELGLLDHAEKEAQRIKEARLGLLERKHDSNPSDLKESDFSGNNHALMEKLESDQVNYQKTNKIRKEINLNRTLIEAESYSDSDNNIETDEDPEPDWIHRWKHYAEQNSTENLRQMWARALAGEIESPGTYSLRTLDFLHSLSQDEALKIAKIGGFELGGVVYKSDFLEKAGIDFPFLLQMDELGLLSGVQGGQVSGLDMTISSKSTDSFFATFKLKNKIMLVTADSPEKSLKLPCYKLTRIGREILKLGEFDFQKEYFFDLGQKIKKQGFMVKIGDWLQVDDTFGRVINPIEI
ncbi:DUF2806 domain-containing protein [Marinobacter alexandrii]|jgi:hypothetical protein|uniref:DUF2806 domain-containing protein n=1 Tax=Marinobacter alexandrii TaxID=2570351 RepID=UPI002ABD1A91|nr:DUF2806 domain-containing protein [Marinobacter alexandrii]